MSASLPAASPDTRSLALVQLRHAFERFGPLPDDVWAALRTPWYLCSFTRGERITSVGQRERRFALMVDGVHRLYFTTPDGNEHTVAFAYSPDFTGVPDAFFAQNPSGLDLEALTDGCRLAIDHAPFAALLDEHRVLADWAWRLFAHALAGRFKREREQLTMTAQERYQRLLRESPQVVQRVPLKHVASYLGMSPETLSRVRSGIS